MYFASKLNNQGENISTAAAAAAAAAKLHQSCQTLCDPIDGVPAVSAIPGILQAKTLECVAISFSSAWKWSRSVTSDSSQPHGLQPTRLLRPWGFFRQEYWSGLPLPSPTALMYYFSYLEPVCCSMSSSNCCCLIFIPISQEAGQVVWYAHLLKNFPQFFVIHTVKGIGIVNKAEIDVFLELSCFFHDLADVGNLISGSSAFSKTSLNIWKYTVHVLLKPRLENFEHYFTSMWDECNCAVV